MKTLEGKVTLVTGSGRGIGRAIALKLASAGARLVINDLDEAPAAETLAAIADLGGEAVACNGDVTAPSFPERFIDTAVDRFGGLDIIVNNAGYTWDSVIQKMTDEQWQTILDLHAGVPFRILRAASEQLRAAAKREDEEGTAIHRKVVNISSVSGLYGMAGQANYAAAKSAVVGLTKTLAKEWGRYKVNVNCVAFGFIETRLTQPLSDEDAVIAVPSGDLKVGMQPEVIAMIKQRTPLGRAGTPEDAAGAVYLLCLPEADFITGQVLEVTGGLTV